MSSVQLITVGAEDSDQRIDRWFKRHFPDLPHGYIEKLLRKGQVRVDGGRVKANQRLEAGQVVRVPPLKSFDKTRRAEPFTRDLTEGEVEDLRGLVLYKDDHLIALNKPAGLAVQGGSKVTDHLDGTLDAFKFGREERPRLVHRLDKDTSGVLLLGRSAKAAKALADVFQSRDVRKLYWALTAGRPLPAEGTISAPLAKEGGKGNERMEVNHALGKKAITHYRTVAFAGRKVAWLELEPKTGRTHQLRAHCALINAPILGDGKYGGAEAFLDTDEVAKQMHLHARAVDVPLPSGGRKVIEAPLANHMARTFKFFDFAEADAGAPFEAMPDE